MTMNGNAITMAQDKLQLDSNLQNFTWLGPKDENGNQQAIKLIDCDFDTLQRFYKHCKSMIGSSDTSHLGRDVLAKNIQKAILYCKAELLVRMFERTPEEWGMSRNVLREQLCAAMQTTTRPASDVKITDAIEGLDNYYNDLDVDTVLTACMNTLGYVAVANKVTLNFIISLGVKPTKEEKKGILHKTAKGGGLVPIEDVIRELLNIRPQYNITQNAYGLTYAELENAYRFKQDSEDPEKFSNKKKYEDLSNDQLLLLANKLLPRLNARCNSQRKNWLDRIEIIQKIAHLKGWDVSHEI